MILNLKQPKRVDSIIEWETIPDGQKKEVIKSEFRRLNLPVPTEGTTHEMFNLLPEGHNLHGTYT